MTNANDLINATGNYKEVESEKQYYPSRGLTKREYFAAMAMQGLVSKDLSHVFMREIAELAVSAADALINELNK